MGRKYAIRDQSSFDFVIFTVINWIDTFIRNHYKEIILDIWMMMRAGMKKSNNKDYQFWKQHNHPIEPEHWIYSSTRDYAGEKGLIEIVFFGLMNCGIQMSETLCKWMVLARR